ncbi:MAG: YfiR family protein [Desulfobacterales bacterium]|nr:YfiR family protein [Desulfobacterales bacterium]
MKTNNIRIRLIIIITCMMAFILMPFHGFSVEAPEYTIKSIFIKKIIKYITWPDNSFNSSDNAINLCFVEENEFLDAFDTLKDKSSKDRPIYLKNYWLSSQTCHILFINSKNRKLVESILSKVKNMPVLTIGEMEGFVELGGIINFIKESDKIRFEINIDSAKRSGFTISSHLLKLSKIFREE